MAPRILDRFWDEKRSLALTDALVLAIAALCVVASICGPRIVSYVVHERTLNINGPAVGVALLVIGYLCAALAFWMLFNLHVFLYRLKQGQVFVAANITALRRISWCCALAAVLCLLTGTVIYLPYAFIGAAAGMTALIVRVIKNAFAQAVRMKDELDLTV